MQQRSARCRSQQQQIRAEPCIRTDHDVRKLRRHVGRVKKGRRRGGTELVEGQESSKAKSSSPRAEGSSPPSLPTVTQTTTSSRLSWHSTRILLAHSSVLVNDLARFTSSPLLLVFVFLPLMSSPAVLARLLGITSESDDFKTDPFTNEEAQDLVNKVSGSSLSTFFPSRSSLSVRYCSPG